MHAWNIRAVNLPEDGVVGVMVSVNGQGFIMQDTLPPKVARQLAGVLIEQADEIDPPAKQTARAARTSNANGNGRRPGKADTTK